jgi:hypothetical protein
LGVTEREVDRGKGNRQEIEREQVSLRGEEFRVREKGHSFFQRAMYAENRYRYCYYLLSFPKNYWVNNIFRPLLVIDMIS